MINVIISEDLVDHDYVRNYTVGYRRAGERAQAYSPEKVAEITGISARRHPNTGARIRYHPAVA